MAGSGARSASQRLRLAIAYFLIPQIQTLSTSGTALKNKKSCREAALKASMQLATGFVWLADRLAWPGEDRGAKRKGLGTARSVQQARMQ